MVMVCVWLSNQLEQKLGFLIISALIFKFIVNSRNDRIVWPTHKIIINYELVMRLEGELVNVRESTAKMGIKRMSSLIEYTVAWSELNQVRFGDWRF